MIMVESVMKLLGSILLLLGLVSVHADQRLITYLQKHPEADANLDGELTLEEAKAHRKQMRGSGTTPSRGGQESIRYSSGDLAKIFEAREFQGVPYRFFAPDAEVHPDRMKFPLILSLHGAGGKGTDNLKNLKSWNGTITEPEFQARYPCYVVVPQSAAPWKVPGSSPKVTEEMVASFPPVWQTMAAARPGFLSVDERQLVLGGVFALLDELQASEAIDADRVYVLGHSMGGFGTFETLAEQPNRFAAAISSAGGLSPWHDPKAFAHVPIWAFHGDKDSTVPIELSQIVFDRLEEVNGVMKLTKLAGVGHGSTPYAFGYTGDSMGEGFETLASSDACDPNEDVWAWLFSQSR